MSLRTPHLAVIDGDPLVCALYEDLFREEGFAPVIFALDTVTRDDLAQTTWEAVIVDPCRNLLDLDWRWLDRLTAIPALHGVPIVIVTGALAPTVPAAWRHVPIVPKPFELEQLLHRVRTATAHAQS